MAQVQCPNCGGYRVVTEKTDSITETHEIVKPGSETAERNSINFFIVLAGGFFVLAFAISKWQIDWIDSLQKFILTVGFAACGFACVGGAIISVRDFLQVRKTGVLRVRHTVEIAERYQFYCQLCGYRWIWRTDEPYPKVNVRPDLIAKANQKIEEEAAAWWYLQQQKKKK